jgi:hypothetical protein
MELSKQIKHDRSRKQYDILMTEHERRVNDKNIDAYQRMETKVDSGGISGLGSHYQNMQKRFLQNQGTFPSEN